MLPRFEQFIRERQFLSNVSPSTLEWYPTLWGGRGSNVETRTPHQAHVLKTLHKRPKFEFENSGANK
jgi:hypothetical protein